MELKLTTKSNEALAGAVQAATTNGNPNVEPVHLLAALAAQPGECPPACSRRSAHHRPP